MTLPKDHRQAHEVQLTGWGESMKGGPWVRFRLQNRESYEWFKQWNQDGTFQQRFYLVASPIGDDERPAEKPRTPFHELPRVKQAGILCNDERFQRWLCASYSLGWSGDPHLKARCFVRGHCVVESTRELDTNVQAGANWDQLVARYREETQLPEQR